MAHPDIAAAARELARAPAGSPWRAVLAARLRLAEAAEAEQRRRARAENKSTAAA